MPLPSSLRGTTNRHVWGFRVSPAWFLRMTYLEKAAHCSPAKARTAPNVATLVRPSKTYTAIWSIHTHVIGVTCSSPCSSCSNTYWQSWTSQFQLITLIVPALERWKIWDPQQLKERIMLLYIKLCRPRGYKEKQYSSSLQHRELVLSKSLGYRTTQIIPWKQKHLSSVVGQWQKSQNLALKV